MIDDLEVRARIDRFTEEHGPYVGKGGWIYHRDGATRDLNPLGPLIAPPKEPHLLYRNILTYHEEMLRRQIKEFDDLKIELEQNPMGNGDPTANLKRLRAKRFRVRDRQRMVEETRAKLRQHLPGYLTPQQLEQEAAWENAKERLRTKVQEINI